MNKDTSVDKKRDFPSTICAIIAIFLILYAIIDFTITQPAIRKNVKTVTTDFIQMKVFLDAKLPEIDSALVKHQEQIHIQSIQLFELNKLSESLKTK